MPSSRRLQRRSVDSEAMTFLRLLSSEFNRGTSFHFQRRTQLIIFLFLGYVDDAIMIYREHSFPVNIFGTLAYQIMDAGTPDARAQVSTLVYNTNVAEQYETARIVFARDHDVGFLRGEEITVQVLSQYTVSCALISQTILRFFR
ncbi:hypothetical protein DFH28DRAFT_929779 [Melampsora americana]|nr:hypothetical protein DFH28DRAFT_929779 [Melampsora americana]